MCARACLRTCVHAQHASTPQPAADSAAVAATVAAPASLAVAAQGHAAAALTYSRGCRRLPTPIPIVFYPNLWYARGGCLHLPSMLPRCPAGSPGVAARRGWASGKPRLVPRAPSSNAFQPTSSAFPSPSASCSIFKTSRARRCCEAQGFKAATRGDKPGRRQRGQHAALLQSKAATRGGRRAGRRLACVTSTQD